MTTEAPPHTLKREMSGFGGMVITLTNLSPCIGVFIASPVIIQQAGSFAIPALMFTVLLGVAVAGIYAELGSAMPHAGGDYVLIGATLGPTMRFAALTGALVGTPVALALSGLGAVDFLKALWTDIPPIPAAMAFIVAATLLGAMSIKTNALVTGLFLFLEFAAVIATGALGVLHPHQDLLQLIVHPVMAGDGGGLRPVRLVEMAVGGSAAIYALNGYGAAIFFGEEVVGARRKMIWMIYGALALGSLTIILPLMGVMLGTRSVAALSASAAPLQDFILEAGGKNMAAAISLAVALAIFNAMIAIVLIGGRILYSAARESAFSGMLNRLFAQVHPRFGSPWAATLTIGVAGLPLCFLPLAVLVLIIGNGSAIGYALMATGLVIGRRTGVTAKSHAPIPLFPVGPIFVISVAIGLVIAGLADKGSGRVGILVTLGIMSLGALYYRLFVRRSSDWAHHEPVEETQMASPLA